MFFQQAANVPRSIRTSWWKLFFQILQLLTQNWEYSSLQHNFRPAKSISVMSCRCAKGKDESWSTAIPPALPALAIHRVLKYILVQVRPNPLMPNSFLSRTHPHREDWKSYVRFAQYLRLPAPKSTMKLQQLGQQLVLPGLLKKVLWCPLAGNPEGIWNLREAFCTQWLLQFRGTFWFKGGILNEG